MIPEPLFPLGTLVATPGALIALKRNATLPSTLLVKHGAGDWGVVDAEDWQANDAAAANRGRVFSAYRLADGTKLWCITEADRSSTCLMLPDEY